MVFITLIASALTNYLFDFIKYAIIDGATTPNTAEKTKLIRFFTTILGVVVWFVVSVIVRRECKFGVLDLFLSLTVGTISNYLHDCNDVLRQFVIALRNRP